ncbi:MAG TPA: flagellar basal-body rod protein FlgF [Terriglobales bacterium]|nr:flagellar basal-body rod protein FlgF [Terriglobales bacterium]
MDPGYYAACTAMMAQAQSLELVANNLANGSTTGYRAHHSVFRSLLATNLERPMSDLNQATNNYGVLEGSRLDLSQGGLQTTSNDLDFALEGSAFFVVQTAGGRLYTRNGSFHLNRQGQLVTSDGDAVLGDKGLIRIPNGPISVSPDGTISVDGAITGKIELVEFGPEAKLESVGKNYYSARSKGTPSTHTRLRQGMLESSNVDPVMSAVDLVTVQRSTEMMQRALSVFDSQFNRIAAEELPRIG